MAINLFDYTQEEEEEIHLPEMKDEQSNALESGEALGEAGEGADGGMGASDGGGGIGGEGGGQGASGGMGAGA